MPEKNVEFISFEIIIPFCFCFYLKNKILIAFMITWNKTTFFYRT